MSDKKDLDLKQLRFELDGYIKAVEEAKRIASQCTGEIKALKRTMDKEFGVSSISAADKLVKKLEKELEEMEKEIDALWTEMKTYDI